ncbi:unnamed protein product [Schistocephalus solidus]|uniref:Uncharacterized protein n=1 Tax=Schistocephalus solidus TaxID=70667 RepID=A0A183TDK4_SCHSO|nr:unnamed protein product [Schistocephalus solidus]
MLLERLSLVNFDSETSKNVIEEAIHFADCLLTPTAFKGTSGHASKVVRESVPPMYSLLEVCESLEQELREDVPSLEDDPSHLPSLCGSRHLPPVLAPPVFLTLVEEEKMRPLTASPTPNTTNDTSPLQPIPISPAQTAPTTSPRVTTWSVTCEPIARRLVNWCLGLRHTVTAPASTALTAPAPLHTVWAY